VTSTSLGRRRGVARGSGSCQLGQGPGRNPHRPPTLSLTAASAASCPAGALSSGPSSCSSTSMPSAGLVLSSASQLPARRHGPGVGVAMTRPSPPQRSNLVRRCGAGRPRVVAKAVALAVAPAESLFNFNHFGGRCGHPPCCCSCWRVKCLSRHAWSDAGIHRLKPLLWTLDLTSPYFLDAGMFSGHSLVVVVCTIAIHWTDAASFRH